jgi:hypothetical protein
VRLELWNGAAGERDRKILRDFESVLPEIPIDDEAWASADELARRARATGISVPATDILIAACARRDPCRPVAEILKERFDSRHAAMIVGPPFASAR